MIETKTTYRIVCDRCGKEQHRKEYESVKIRSISFTCHDITLRARHIKEGDVCEECFKDFCELAESFFDDLNKTEKGGEAE